MTIVFHSPTMDIQRAWIHLTSNILIGIRRLLFGVPKAPLLQAKQAHFPQPLCAHSSPLTILVALRWAHSALPTSPLYRSLLYSLSAYIAVATNSKSPTQRCSEKV